MPERAETIPPGMNFPATAARFPCQKTWRVASDGGYNELTNFAQIGILSVTSGTELRSQQPYPHASSEQRKQPLRTIRVARKKESAPLAAVNIMARDALPLVLSEEFQGRSEQGSLLRGFTPP
jgi:hypothetical protein